MFAAAVIAKRTTCKTVKDLMSILKEYDPETPLQSGFEMGVDVLRMENKKQRSEIYLSFEESEEADDDEDDDDE